MKNRVIAALLSVCLALSLSVSALALTTASVSEAEAAQVVNALGIMVGDAKGDLMLEARVTRAEFITMAVKATPGGEQVGQAATSPYPDVPYTHWSAGYVEAGVAAGLISGYSDGTFRPDHQITLAEGATIVLQLLGYTAADFSGAYPTGQLAMYRSLKLDRGLTAQDASSLLTRRDTMYLFYNLMSAKNKEGTPYLTVLGHDALNASGQVDQVKLLNALMEGPVVAESGWTAALPFDAARARVYRGGAPASLSAVQNGDVVYWNASMAAIWAYSEKVTGTIQALGPTLSAPSSVQVSGRTFEIETSAAAYALSDLGSYGVGDTVTLLLGRDGGVAAVSESAAGSTEHLGVVTAVTVGSYTEGSNGPSYNADTVTVMATDGKTYSYQWSAKGMREGALVRVVISDNGALTLKGVSDARLTGKVSSDGAKVGKYAFADGAEILDVWEGSACRVYPSRLAGMTLEEDMVRYYSLNAQGEINRMILKDATGDVHHYGILTRMESQQMGEMSAYYSYRYDIGGVVNTLEQVTTRFPVEMGPVQVQGEVTNPRRILPLTSVKADRIAGGILTSGSRSYTLSDDVLYYEYQNNSYRLSTLSRVQESGLSLTGWYDKPENEGGRIRVVLAR